MRPPAEAGAFTLPAPKSARVIAFIGQIAEHKGPDLLIQAFRTLRQRYPDSWLAVAGPILEWKGDAWAKDLRRRTLKDSLIRDHTIFLGHVDNVAALLDRSLCLVVPSTIDDAAPNVVVEAKQAGRPSIVFPRGGLPELVQHDIDGLVCRDCSPAALVECLERYFENSDLARDHGRAAKASLERLNVKSFAASWYEVYQCASQDQARVPERDFIKSSETR